MPYKNARDAREAKRLWAERKRRAEGKPIREAVQINNRVKRDTEAVQSDAPPAESEKRLDSVDTAVARAMIDPKASHRSWIGKLFASQRYRKSFEQRLLAGKVNANLEAAYLKFLGLVDADAKNPEDDGADVILMDLSDYESPAALPPPAPVIEAQVVDAIPATPAPSPMESEPAPTGYRPEAQGPQTRNRSRTARRIGGPTTHDAHPGR